MDSNQTSNPFSSPQNHSEGFSGVQKKDALSGVSRESISLLSQTRPWVLLLAILGFIFSGLIVMIGLAMALAGVAGAATGPGGAVGIVLAVFYCAMGALYLVPALFLFRYAGAIKDLRLEPGVGQLNNALRIQKSFWKFVGITMAVVIAVYVGMIFLVFVFGAFSTAV